MINDSNNGVAEVLEELDIELEKELKIENTKENEDYNGNITQCENDEQIEEKFELVTNVESNTVGTTQNGECWALVCYKEKTFFQKIIYSLKKICSLTVKRILGKE